MSASMSGNSTPDSSNLKKETIERALDEMISIDWQLDNSAFTETVSLKKMDDPSSLISSPITSVPMQLQTPVIDPLSIRSILKSRPSQESLGFNVYSPVANDNIKGKPTIKRLSLNPPENLPTNKGATNLAIPVPTQRKSLHREQGQTAITKRLFDIDHVDADAIKELNDRNTSPASDQSGDILPLPSATNLPRPVPAPRKTKPNEVGDTAKPPIPQPRRTIESPDGSTETHDSAGAINPSKISDVQTTELQQVTTTSSKRATTESPARTSSTKKSSLTAETPVFNDTVPSAESPSDFFNTLDKNEQVDMSEATAGGEDSDSAVFSNESIANN